MTPAPIRCLVDPAAPGARNMAVDEALMASARSGEVVLRLYGWSPPCLSLGRNQRGRGRFDREAAREMGVDVVRRPTGGRSVYHDREVTYAVAAPAERWGSLRESYRLLNRALLAGLRSLGVEAREAGRSGPAPGPDGRACFRDPLPGEIVVGGRKLVGSAQWRNGGALLQHGSILLRAEQEMAERLRTGAGGEATSGGPEDDAVSPDGDDEGGSPATPDVGLGELLGREPEPGAVAAALREGFSETLGAPVRPSGLTPAEEARAAELEGRYRDEAWTWRR